MSPKNKSLSLVLALISFFFSCSLEAKRRAPKKVEPIIFNGVKYVAPYFRSRSIDSGKKKIWFIEAFDTKSEKKLWTLDIYQKDIDPKLESDVQDVFISKLEMHNNNLLVTNEKKESYLVELKKNNTKPQKITRIYKPIPNSKQTHQPNFIKRNLVYLAFALALLFLFGIFVLLIIRKK